METMAKVETVTVRFGEPFPLSFQDEVVDVQHGQEPEKAGSKKYVKTATLTVLRRGV